MDQQVGEVVSENSWVYLEDNRGEGRIVKLTKDKTVFWRKQKVELGPLIGKEFNTFYKLDAQFKLEQVDSKIFYDIAEIEHQEVEITKTNKELYDKNDSQKLTQDDILMMKQEQQGEEIVKTIVSNSETFNQKTEYSQAKYVKKKKEKYVFCFLLQKTTVENIHKVLFDESPAKVNFMRLDMFAIFLQLSGIRPNSNILLFDNTGGLAAAGVAERLDGEGDLHIVYPGQKKGNLQVVQQLNLDEARIKRLRIRKDFEQLAQEKFTHLLVCGEFSVKEIFEKFVPALERGGVLVAFSSFLEKLSELSELLIQSKGYTRVEILDTFMRYYQVLENRTHPKVDMVAFGGYVLVAYKLS